MRVLSVHLLALIVVVIAAKSRAAPTWTLRRRNSFYNLNVFAHRLCSADQAVLPSKLDCLDKAMEMKVSKQIARCFHSYNGTRGHDKYVGWDPDKEYGKEEEFDVISSINYTCSNFTKARELPTKRYKAITEVISLQAFDRILCVASLGRRPSSEWELAIKECFEENEVILKEEKSL